MLYRANKTMEMLGNHTYTPILRGGVAAEAFNDMLNAHKEKEHIHYVDIAGDAFILGYIYGKRAERAKKKK